MVVGATWSEKDACDSERDLVTGGGKLEMGEGVVVTFAGKEESA